MSSFDKIRNYLNTKGGDKVKKVLSSKETLIIAILAGIILIIASTSMFTGNKADTKAPSQIADNNNNNAEIGSAAPTDKSINIKEIEGIISKIAGAGKVSVMIAYENGIEKVPGTDTNTSETNTVEKDAQGGNRAVTDTKQDSKVVYEGGDAATKNVFVTKEIQPTLKGILIVASGASDVEVKANISKSAQILFNLPMHKIQVVEGNK
ncbi:MAG TPA: stage III sporulation protein AG [Clostridia bacterium]|nr:stage III sporulation protein AG [Clostridia bacterium]